MLKCTHGLGDCPDRPTVTVAAPPIDAPANKNKTSFAAFIVSASRRIGAALQLAKNTIEDSQMQQPEISLLVSLPLSPSGHKERGK